MKPFERYQDLFLNIKTSKKFDNQLEKEALKWFKENFGAVFGSTTNCDTKNRISYHYSAGTLMFGVPNIGDYYYNFIMKAIHFKYFNVRAYNIGYAYGQKCSKSKMKISNTNYRDGNPFAKVEFYNHSAWDCGYIFGLSNYRFDLRK